MPHGLKDGIGLGEIWKRVARLVANKLEVRILRGNLCWRKQMGRRINGKRRNEEVKCDGRVLPTFDE